MPVAMLVIVPTSRKAQVRSEGVTHLCDFSERVVEDALQALGCSAHWLFTSASGAPRRVLR